MRVPEAISDYGSVNSDGKKSVSYGILFDKTADTCEYSSLSSLARIIACLIHNAQRWAVEALNGTLRAAKRQKKVITAH